MKTNNSKLGRTMKGMMEPFYNRFPDVAERETRCLIVLDEKNGLPAGEYFLLESYCNDPECDCRRVFINVAHKDKIWATIGYGWEKLDFYEQWMGEKDLAKYAKGPVLELTAKYTEYSEAILELFKKVAVVDASFMERLKRHYKMFKNSDNKKKGGNENLKKELENFDPDAHTIGSLCKETGTGIDAINDTNREAFFPLLSVIEETIWNQSTVDSALKDSEIIKSLKNIRDNIFSENAAFNELEKDIIKQTKLVLFLNSYDKRDLSLSISCVLKSVKLHRSIGGSRGYLTFISGFFE